MNLEEVLSRIILEINFTKLSYICNELNISIDELLNKLWEKGYFGGE